MNRVVSRDFEWARWTEIHRAAALLWFESDDTDQAIRMVSQFLDDQLPLDIQRAALAFRGDLYRDREELVAASSDFRRAHRIAKLNNFERYSLEDSLAEICGKLGDRDGEEQWTTAAIETAADDPRESGTGALSRLLRLQEQSTLTQHQLRLAERIVTRAWRAARLPGKPDLANLVNTTNKLLAAGRARTQEFLGPDKYLD